MGRTCTVCTHPHAAAVERDLLAGISLRRVGDRYGLNRAALHRHKGSHITQAVVLEAQETRVVSVLDRMETLAARIEMMLEAAERRGSPSTFTSVAKELWQSLELIARLRRELDERPQVNVLMHPEYLAMRSILLGALEPYPDARAAVADRLLELGHANRG